MKRTSSRAIFVLAFAFLITNLPIASAEPMPKISVLQSSAIKTLKEFSKVHSDRVSWNEAEVIKAIKNSKTTDWVGVDEAYALRKNGWFNNGTQLVLRPEMWGGAKENKWAANIRKQVGENADKFVYIHVSSGLIYKKKVYRSFNLVPFMPWTDIALGFTVDDKVVDIGTAGVGCFTLPAPVRRAYNLACAD